MPPTRELVVEAVVEVGMMQPDMPGAVASGPTGSALVSDRVRPARVAIVIGILAAGFVLSLYATRELPGVALRLVGQPSAGVARYGGIVGTKPGGQSVEIPRVRGADAPDVIAQLESGTELEFAVVRESLDDLKPIVELGLLAPRSGPEREPWVEYDSWRDEAGTRHDNTTAVAHGRAALEAMFREAIRHGWSLPPNTKLVYEPIQPSHEASDQRPTYRAYFVEASEIGTADVANATATYDAVTNRPLVALELTREGAAKFGVLTTRVVGHKIAIIVGGVVKSAPVITGPVLGGRVQITMGGGDVREMSHERDVLVGVLSRSNSPGSQPLTGARWVPSTGSANPFVARAMLALLAGLLAALVAFATVRFARPERAMIPELAGGASGLVRRVAWTAFAMIVAVVGSCWTLPGINGVELAHVLAWGSKHVVDESKFSIFALGLTPLLTSFIAVEIIASIVPRWRSLRDGVVGRRKLDRATAIATILVVCAQAYFMTKYLGALDRGGSEIFDSRMFWSCAAALAGGPIVLAVLASLITSRGIGNGYVVLMLTTWLWAVPWTSLVYTDVVSHAKLVFTAVTIVVAGTFGLALTSWRIRAPGRVSITLPVGGLAPLSGGGGLLFLLGALALVGLKLSSITAETRDILRTDLLVAIVACLVATAIWGFVFARPGRRRDTLATVPLEPTSGEQWLRAVVLSGVALGAVVAIDHVRPRGALEFADPVVVMLAAVALGDLRAEWRARRRANLVPVWPLHDPLLVDVARARLEAAEIPSFIQATRFRTLTALFASYAPMMVFVPADQATRAHALLRDWLEPTEPNVDLRPVMANAAA
ncbi:hypothetical protein BH11MYX1_BH11MYX1_55640 [soil metagenome]